LKTLQETPILWNEPLLLGVIVLKTPEFVHQLFIEPSYFGHKLVLEMQTLPSQKKEFMPVNCGFLDFFCNKKSGF